MTTPIHIKVSITLESGLHIGTGFGMAKLLDERTIRSPHADSPTQTLVPYIPGASLKGRLRACAATLAQELALPDAEELRELVFGSTRVAGRLIFPDAHIIDEDRTSCIIGDGPSARFLAYEERMHVALSRTRRSAREGMLMRIEVASSGLRMETTLRGWLPDERPQLVRGLALLVLAIRRTTHLGGHKSRGLGAVHMRPQQITVGREIVPLEELAEALL